MRFTWPDDLLAFRDEVRAYAAGKRSPGLDAEIERADRDGLVGPIMRSVGTDLDGHGWMRISWPEDLGGQAKSPWYQFIVTQELRYHHVAFTRTKTASMVGPAIQRYGSDEQRQKYLPRIWSNELTCALGYSEPNAGTDLASLKTRAVRDGDEYVINGQKIWTSGAHRCNHVWLAARTDPDAPRHRGISVLLVPLDTPGITIRPIWAMNGERTNEVFYDNVRVPAHALIGEENRGWYIMATALDHERVSIGVESYVDVVQVFEGFLDYLAHERTDLLEDAAVRMQIAELKLQLHVGRALLLTCSAVIADGGAPAKESSMGKVWFSELRYRMATMAMDILGRAGATPGPGAPCHGALEQMYRGATVVRFAGGTNEVQRDIIAQRGLGLPRQ